jgi:hypothetical protein
MAPNVNLPYRGRAYVDCPHAGDTGYAAATGISVASVDYAPTETMMGVLLTGGSGNVAFELEGGGVMTLPFTVDTGDVKEVLRGIRISKILKTGTTFSGYIYPLF